MNFALFMAAFSLAIVAYANYTGTGNPNAAYMAAQIWIAAYWLDSRKG